MQKICSKCKLEKPYEEFYKKKGGLAGLHSHCKACMIASSKVLTPEQKEMRRANVRKRYLIIKEKRKAEAKEWKNKNPSYFRDYYHRKRKFVDQKNRLQKREGLINGTDHNCSNHDRSGEITGLF